MKSSKITRRDFNRKSSTLAFGLAALETPDNGAKILGANDQIGAVFVGVSTRGRQLMSAFNSCKKTKIVGISDVDSAIMGNAAKTLSAKVTQEKDFRVFLDKKDVDVIVIATPDHWHAFQTIESCKAEKDVYIESPLSNTIVEGRKMVEAAKKYKRIVQTGFYRRSMPFYKKLIDDKTIARLGRITVSRCASCTNMQWRGIGNMPRKDPPATLDWDLWLGPRYQPYQDNITPFKYQWWSDYSSRIASQGCSDFDIVRLLLQEQSPVSVCAMGGRFALRDDRTVPDTVEVVFQFPSNRLLTFSLFEACGNPVMATNEKYQPLGQMEIRGSSGTLYLDDNRYQIKSERPGLLQPTGGNRMKEESFELDEAGGAKLDPVKLHTQNFLDCVRSRKTPNAPLVEAHYSTVMALMANVSLLTGMKLEWDNRREQFTNYEPANKLLHYEYRAPWKLD